MEHTSNPFPKNTKVSNPSKLTKIIAVILFVLVVASLVFYLKSSRTSNIGDTKNETPITSEDKTKDDNAVVVNAKPESVDLGMVENDLTQTSKNLDTVDNLDNL